MATHTPNEDRTTNISHPSDEEVDGIVRVTSYRRNDLCEAVIWFPLDQHKYIASSISTPFPRALLQEFHRLERLPAELMHNILLSLDMCSLFKLRQTTSQLRRMVDSVNQYQIVTSHGLNLFCALLRTKFAHNISLFSFYQTLCIKHCKFCGEYAGFVSIPTRTRCCFECLQQKPEVQVQWVRAMERKYHLTKAQLRRFRSLKSLPGVYGDSVKFVRNSSIVLVSACEVLLTFGRNSNAFMDVMLGSYEQPQDYNFRSSCALPYYDKMTGVVEHGVSCAECLFALKNDGNESEGEKRSFEARDKVYATDGFLEHFKYCERARLLWISSK